MVVEQFMWPTVYGETPFYFVIVKVEALWSEQDSPDLLFYWRWVLINSGSLCYPMCLDKTARGSSITSRVIQSEHVHASRWEVLTFPIKALGKDETTLTATMRRGTRSGETAELAGSRGWGQEVAVFPTRRKLPSSCRGWSHYCWMWVTLPGIHCAFSPQAFIWSQGIWILHVVPRALEYCTVSKSLVPCT